MEEHFAWMTTRRIKPGTLAEFKRAWRPDTHPDGMRRAYAYWLPGTGMTLRSRAATGIASSSAVLAASRTRTRWTGGRA
jgi:hypothetical protein